MASDFPTPTLAVALCISTLSLLAHAAGLAAYHHKTENIHKSCRILLRRQTLYSAFIFCSSLAALLLAEFSSHSPKLPLTWSLLSVVFLEVRPPLSNHGTYLPIQQADRRELQAFNQESTLTYSPLLSYVRPLSLM